MNHRRTLATVVICLLGALALAGCGSDSPADGDPTRVSFVLDWFPNVDHAGVFAAVDQGFFADEGLAVTPSVPSDPTAALKQVGTGRADFAISYEQEVLIARAAGVPVVAVGALVTHPLNTVLVRQDRGISSARDLEGRTVGISGVPSDRPLLNAVVRSAGGDPSKVVVRTIGFTLAPALAAGKVDAVLGAYWNVEQIDLQRQGIDVAALRLEDNGVPDYDELVVVTSDATVQKRPDVVRSFLRGLGAGQEWAASNQDGAVASLLRANEDLDRDTVRAQLEVTAPLLSPPDAAPLALDPAEWAVFSDWMRANGLLPPRADVSRAVSAAFLPGEG